MLANLAIYHEAKPLSYNLNWNSINSDSLENWFHWETCLRKISIGFPSNIKNENNSALVAGADAYEFLLQILSGLHSPILGETEVLGQFRAHMDLFLSQLETKESSWRNNFKILQQSTYRDVKNIREKFLKNTGTKSYGSIARKYCKDYSTIFVIGCGNLAQEIYPWVLSPRSNIQVFARSKKQILLKNSEFIEVRELCHLEKKWEDAGEASNAKRALILAAPIENFSLESMGLKFDSQDLILDYREGKIFPLGSYSMIPFAQMMEELRDSSEKSKKACESAKRGISKLLEEKYWNRLEAKPFGWEDICA